MVSKVSHLRKEWFEIGNIVRHNTLNKVGVIVTGCVGKYQVQLVDGSKVPARQDELFKYDIQSILSILDWNLEKTHA